METTETDIGIKTGCKQHWRCDSNQMKQLHYEYKLIETELKNCWFKATDIEHNVSLWIQCSLHNSVKQQGESK